MASPSEDHQNQEESPAIKEMLYKTKLIQFLGRTTPIVLQNDNGPCPLLAICNLLLLRNNLNLSSDVVEVSQEKLLSLVADRLINSNSNVDNKDAGYVENQQQNIADAIDLLPRLATGIDVNIKFTRINDFEFTRECAIFDLLDIPLYHGWIVDPQDSETSNAIGLKSYNTLMGELVYLETQNPINVFMKNHKEDCVDLVAATSENSNVTHLKKHEPSTANDNTLANDCIDDLITFETVPGQDVSSSSKSDKESPNPQMNNSVSEKRDKTSVDYDVLIKTENITLGSSGSYPSPPVDILVHNSGGDEKILDQSILTADVNAVEKVNIGAQTIDESKSLDEHVYEGEECISETIQVDKVSTSADDTSPKDGTTARQGELITNFLKNSASQLTIYGLFSLQDGLKERELCVFFRNNHFNTMFKFEGELYILATDQGYINQPDLVWEKLNEVNGDTVFMTNNFKEFKAENHSTRSWDEQNAMANTADYLASIDNTAQTGASFNSDLQLAIALQQQEFEQQQQPQRVLPQPTTIGRSGLVVGPQHVHPSRPRNLSSSSRQEPKPSKDKCTLM